MLTKELFILFNKTVLIKSKAAIVRLGSDKLFVASVITIKIKCSLLLQCYNLWFRLTAIQYFIHSNTFVHCSFCSESSEAHTGRRIQGAGFYQHVRAAGSDHNCIYIVSSRNSNSIPKIFNYQFNDTKIPWPYPCFRLP